MKRKQSAVALCLSFLAVCSAGTKPPAPSSQHEAKSQSDDLFAPYAFLIGEWDVKSEGSDNVVAVQRVRWGPNRSYMWYAVALLENGREEPHLEGVLMWNGLHKNLDMLFAIDLKNGRSQEQGTMSVAPDGSLVREIMAVHSAGVPTSSGNLVGPKGVTKHFRQTYKQIGPDKIQTSIMRETDHGWVASFPGSDRMVMTRRAG